jgi:excisionase family DNA binding protein
VTPHIRDVFTTGQVAKICRVCPRTVAVWIDAGHLKGFKMPGGSDRRVTRSALKAFMTEYKMPAEWFASMDVFAPDVLKMPTLATEPDRAA